MYEIIIINSCLSLPDLPGVFPMWWWWWWCVEQGAGWGGTGRDVVRYVSATTGAPVTPPRDSVPVLRAGSVPSARVRMVSQTRLQCTASCHIVINLYLLHT